MGVPFGVGRFVGSSGKPSLHSGYWEKPHLGTISRHRLPLTVCRLQRHCPSAPCLSAIGRYDRSLRGILRCAVRACALAAEIVRRYVRP